MDIVKPVNTVLNRVLEDKRPTTEIIEVFDLFTIPATTEREVTMRTVEVPLKGIPLPTYDPTDYIVVKLADSPFTRFTIVDTVSPPGTLASYEIRVDDDTYSFGYIGFSPDDAGKAVKITYHGRGSLVNAADINDLSTGFLLRDGAVRSRHIYQGGTGPDGFTGSSDFVFASDVGIGATLTVGGNLNVTGDLNITGVVNKSTSEVIDVTDDILRLNSGATGPGPDVGIEIWRGSTSSNPQLIWDESDDAWLVRGTTGIDLLSISDNKTVKICDGGLFKPPTYSADPTPTVDMIPGTYYNSTDRQYKGIISDGVTGAMIVILG